MLIFNNLIFEGQVISASSEGARSDPRFNEIMGAVEVLHVSGYATQLVGTPTLDLNAEVSLDNQLWTPYYGILSQMLAGSGEVIFQAFYPNALARVPFMRIRAKLSTLNTQAYLRIFATGRDRSRRARRMT